MIDRQPDCKNYTLCNSICDKKELELEQNGKKQQCWAGFYSSPDYRLMQFITDHQIQCFFVHVAAYM